ncbi:hypothetical protein CK507_11890 [Pseudomonas sp. WN033]|nr:hypothetical protein CK507_11890 [Pseudomonas sp. WN033]
MPEPSQSERPASAFPWPALLLASTLILITGLLLALLHYQLHSRAMLSSGNALFNQIAKQLQYSLAATYNPPRRALNLLALDALPDTENLEQRLTRIPMLAQVLTDNPQLNSVYIGWDSGDYLMLRPLPNQASRDRFNAPEAAHWMVWHIAAGQHRRPVVIHLYLDQAFKLLESQHPPHDGFDPRTRPWYEAAKASANQIITTPYVFFSTNEFGTTMARPAGDNAVLGADLTLSQLSTLLAEHRITPSSELLIYDAEGTVIAYHDVQRIISTSRSGPLRLKRFNELGSTLLAALALDGYQVERQQTMTLEGRHWQVLQQRLPVKDTPDSYLAILVPDDELLTDAYRIRRQSVFATLLLMLVLVPLVWLAARRRSGAR